MRARQARCLAATRGLERLTAALWATAMTFDFDYENVIVTRSHRDRLEAVITEMAGDGSVRKSALAQFRWRPRLG